MLEPASLISPFPRLPGQTLLGIPDFRRPPAVRRIGEPLPIRFNYFAGWVLFAVPSLCSISTFFDSGSAP